MCEPCANDCYSKDIADAINKECAAKAEAKRLAGLLDLAQKEIERQGAFVEAAKVVIRERDALSEKLIDTNLQVRALRDALDWALPLLTNLREHIGADGREKLKGYISLTLDTVAENRVKETGARSSSRAPDHTSGDPGESPGGSNPPKGSEKRKNDWCSNCGAVLASTEGLSFPSCSNCA